MTSSIKKSFRSRLAALPPEIRALARKNFRLWLRDPRHPSIHFKPVGRCWSARVGSDYRALAIVNGEHAEWFWIGLHDEYERIIRSL
jgi:hypothetical protein